LITIDSFKSLLSPRPRDAHKGLFGHVLIVGGNYGMAGAVRLAGESALRTGAGLVTVATQPEHIVAVMSERPEIMAHGVKNARNLKPLLAKATVIVVGVGLGQISWSKRLLKQVLCSSQPKVIDADALNLLAKQPEKSEKWILTPHPGEAARLLSGVIVLKGACSLVCTSNSLSICKAGNPGMASGGMSDVLSGIIAGLLAQQFNLQQAAELGVYLHASAGDLVAKQRGERGMLASDLMPYLSNVINL
jgi:NAD(P)H-hydrate repair Nnr-like enzyme with NAD(P)H-hydrate dehydratase domain